MKNCCVCGSNEECSNVLFTGEDSVDKKICGTCARKIQVLNNMNDSSVQEVEGAINHFYNNVNNKVSDMEVKSWLLKFLPEKASRIKEMKGNGSISYTSYNSSEESSFKWIEILTALAWISFIPIVFWGMWLWYSIGGFLGFFAFLGSILASFLYIAPIMVFVNMAENLSTIRKILEKK